MANSWVQHVKSIAEKEKIPYPMALLKAKETYKKKDVELKPVKEEVVVESPLVKSKNKKVKA